MTKPIIVIDGVEREMNNAEYAQYETDVLEAQARNEAKAKAEADKIAAQAKLAALGLTTDDLKALGL